MFWARRIVTEELSDEPAPVLAPPAAPREGEFIHALLTGAPALYPVPVAHPAFSNLEAALQLRPCMTKKDTVPRAQHDAFETLELPKVHALAEVAAERVGLRLEGVKVRKGVAHL